MAQNETMIRYASLGLKPLYYCSELLRRDAYLFFSSRTDGHPVPWAFMSETLCAEFIQIQMTFIFQKCHLIKTYLLIQMNDLGPSYRCSEFEINLRIANLICFAFLHSYYLFLAFWINFARGCAH